MLSWPFLALILLALLPKQGSENWLRGAIRARGPVALLAIALLATTGSLIGANSIAFVAISILDVAVVLEFVHRFRSWRSGASRWAALYCAAAVLTLQLLAFESPPLFFPATGKASFWFVDIFNKLFMMLALPALRHLHLADAVPRVLEYLAPSIVFLSRVLLGAHFLGCVVILLLIYELLRARVPSLRPSPPFVDRPLPIHSVALAGCLWGAAAAVPDVRVITIAWQCVAAVIWSRGLVLLWLLSGGRPWIRSGLTASIFVMLVHPRLFWIPGWLAALDGTLGLSSMAVQRSTNLELVTRDAQRVIWLLRRSMRLVPLLALAALMNFVPFRIENHLGTGAPREPLTGSESSATSIVDTVHIDTTHGGFDIDRFEYPNRRGVVPRSGSSPDEARARCHEREMHLCTRDEWYWACSGGGQNGYLLGAGPETVEVPALVQACNVERPSRGLVPSGTFEECRSDSGVQDLIGNAWEWVELSGRDGFVGLVGSSFRYGDDLSTWCPFAVTIHPSQLQILALDEIGFRCCR